MDAYSELLIKNKNSCQPLAVLQNLDPAANNKPCTWPPYKKTAADELKGTDIILKE